MKTPKSIKEIIDHHFNGGKFEYLSTNFKAAKEDYGDENLKDVRLIPDEIREKHNYWRIGKLRHVDFAPNGKPFRIKLGAMYAVTFYEYNLDLAKIRLI